MTPDLATSDKLDIGIISDTHGHLSARARSVLGRSDVIIHAGDIDTPEILSALQELAPVIAVRGNMDYGNWAERLPPADMVELGGVTLYVLHNLNTLDIDPGAAGVRVVVSGHTHQSAAVRADGVLYLNPGSATSPRYGADASVAMLQVVAGNLNYQFSEVA